MSSLNPLSNTVPFIPVSPLTHASKTSTFSDEDFLQLDSDDEQNPKTSAQPDPLSDSYFDISGSDDDSDIEEGDSPQRKEGNSPKRKEGESPRRRHMGSTTKALRVLRAQTQKNESDTKSVQALVDLETAFENFYNNNPSILLKKSTKRSLGFETETSAVLSPEAKPKLVNAEEKPDVSPEQKPLSDEEKLEQCCEFLTTLESISNKRLGSDEQRRKKEFKAKLQFSIVKIKFNIFEKELLTSPPVLSTYSREAIIEVQKSRQTILSKLENFLKELDGIKFDANSSVQKQITRLGSIIGETQLIWLQRHEANNEMEGKWLQANQRQKTLIEDKPPLQTSRPIRPGEEIPPLIPEKKDGYFGFMRYPFIVLRKALLFASSPLIKIWNYLFM